MTRRPKRCPELGMTARFADADAAGRAVTYLNATTTPPLEAYRCVCGRYHLRPRQRGVRRLLSRLSHA